MERWALASPAERRQAGRVMRAGRLTKAEARVREACPDITDPAEIRRRAEALLKAQMIRLSGLAARKRAEAAEARRQAREAEAELAGLAAAGPDDAGSDGVDAG